MSSLDPIDIVAAAKSAFGSVPDNFLAKLDPIIVARHQNRSNCYSAGRTKIGTTWCLFMWFHIELAPERARQLCFDKDLAVVKDVLGRKTPLKDSSLA